MASTQGLRYSPVNWLIVDWNFPVCGLPQPQACPTTPTTAAPTVCAAVPMVAPPDTYDWVRFLPNMQEGLEDPDDDICADRVREAAIDFARKSWVLQREVSFVLQKDETFYPVTPLPGERTVAVISVKHENSGCVPCGGFMGRTKYGVEFDVRQNGINITSDRSCLCSMVGQVITVLVAVAPTEDACAYDVMLYDHYRAAITAEARRRYVRTHHYKERMLLQAQATEAAFDQAALIAKRYATKFSTQDKGQQTPLLFQGNRVFRGRQQMYGYYPYSGRQF
jgi:hypothetical protein